MSFEHMCAILVVEPYSLSIAEIAELTDYQLTEIYFRPRDKDGEPLSDLEIERQQEVEDGDFEPMSFSGYKGVFWKINRDGRGMSDEETMVAWREYLKTDPDEARLHPEDLKSGN